MHVIDIILLSTLATCIALFGYWFGRWDKDCATAKAILTKRYNKHTDTH